MTSLSVKGYASIAAGSILFGLIAIFVKLLTGMPLGSIIFFRLLFALAVMALYLYLCGRVGELRPGEKKIYLLMLGMFQAGTMLAFFASVEYTTVSIAVLLLYTAPIYVALLSPRLLDEHGNHTSLFALAISIAGVILVVQPQTAFHTADKSYLTGIAAGFASGVSYAGMILTSRYIKNDYKGRQQAAWALFLTMIIFIPYSWAAPSGVLKENLLLLILFGLVSSSALVLYLGGLTSVRAHDASIIALLEPVSAVVFSFIILKEPISLFTIMGGGLILISALMVGLAGQEYTPDG